MGSFSNLVVSIRYIQISFILLIIKRDLILLTEVQTIKWQHRVPWVENLTAQAIQLTYVYGLICLPAGKFNQEFEKSVKSVTLGVQFYNKMSIYLTVTGNLFQNTENRKFKSIIIKSFYSILVYKMKNYNTSIFIK